MFSVPPGQRVVGMQLPVQARSTYFVADWERAAGPTEMATVARACDDAGFAYIGVCDHVALPEAVADSMGFHWVDPIATLGWLAAQTTRTHLLTHVYVLPYRHPLLAAKQFATLDDSRGRSLDEGVPLLARALSDEVVDGFGAQPRPAQRPRPPIWLAGSSAPAIRRAARLGDGWLPQGPASPEHVAALLAEREACGRGDEPLAVGTITPFLHVGEASWDLPADTLSGPPDVLAAAVLERTPAGVNQLQVRFRARDCEELCDQIAAFADGVLPAVSVI
jgi:alkanesulfonate monooxygenase SsuD/methylene tetrahydromethanopterin reductase-like flavin-dependent oxidoreductase (luciferase family)